MARHETADVRNVAFAGHGASGKTTLVEACLVQAKVLKRLGSVTDGTSLCDFDELEKQQQRSIDTAVAGVKWKGKHINFIDTPGYPDSMGEAIAGMSAADAVILAIDATAGVKVNTRQMWKIAEELNLPRAIVVTRADQDHARWDALMPEIVELAGQNALPIVVPQSGQMGVDLAGVEVAHRALEEGSDAAKAAGNAIVERAVEADEDLMMRYLEGETLGPDDIRNALSAALRAGTLHPIFLTSAEKGVGVAELLDALVDFFPSPEERTFAASASKSGEETEEVEVRFDQPFVARVFKVNFDPFVGKLAYLRIVSGSIQTGATIRTPDVKASVRLAHLYSVHGKETKEIEGAVAGDIIALSKIDELNIDDTAMSGDLRVRVVAPSYPTPMVGLAVEAKSRADDTKIVAALQKLVDADQTLSLERSSQTNELVISGMSTLHLDTIFARLKGRYKIEVNTRLPKVPYLETITGKGVADYRHKKQTGGAGQFAHVYLRIEPLDRGGGFEFKSEVVGGAISSGFLPSIEKGIKSTMSDGVLAGFKFVDAKVVVYDGKEHPVDSKDIAFQIAGRNAFKAAVQKAKPVLLEPIVDVEIIAPQDSMGALMGDLNTRRGRIQTSESQGQLVVIKAQVPLAEMQTYSSELRSITGGEGSYSMEHSHYDPVPQHVAQQVIAKYKSKDDEGA
ncbi:elongation factor G [Planctomycetota bacterium]